MYPVANAVWIHVGGHIPYYVQFAPVPLPPGGGMEAPAFILPEMAAVFTDFGEMFRGWSVNFLA